MLDLNYKTKFEWDESILQQKTVSVDLGLFKDGFDFDDQIRFQVLGNILSTLCDRSPNCENILLYKGPLGWDKLVGFSKSYEAKYLQWTSDLFPEKGQSPITKSIFAANVLMEYLHRIASFGTEHIQFYVEFTDIETFEKPLLALLLSKNRFTHFNICNDPFDGNVGFVLPKEEMFEESILEKISQILQKHDEKVRFLPEEMIPQLWHELNTLYAIEGKITKFGYRGILGFEAAEGEVIYI